MDQLLNHWAEICASIVAIGSFLALIWRYIIRPSKENISRILTLHEELEKLVPVVKSMQKELKPNGGSSLFDTIKRIDDTLVIHTQKFNFLMTYESKIAFETDGIGHCVWVSPKWQELTGISYEDAMGWGWVNSIHSDDREKVTEEWKDAITSRRPFSYQDYRFHNILRDHIVTMTVIANPLVSNDGILLGYLGVAKTKGPN